MYLPEHIKWIANRHSSQELAPITLLAHVIHQNIRSQTKPNTHHLGLWQGLSQVLDNQPDILRVTTRKELRRCDLGVGTSTSIENNTAIAVDLGDVVDESADVGFVTASGQSVEED